jgi:NADH:ubiquinone oxidoreductase subunit F (NADH-binding)/(2Fe-2S) ferredoxin/NAD-dependent dihydropyrimidine dehydrogenase PreA subunit
MNKEVLTKYQAIEAQVKQKHEAAELSNKIIIQVGNATCENAAGAREVQQEFEKLIMASRRTDIIIKQTGCTGRCAAEPIVSIYLSGKSPIKYEAVTPEKAGRIFHETVQNNQLVLDYLLDKKTDNIYKNLVTFLCSDITSNKEQTQRIEQFTQILTELNIPDHTIRVFQGSGFGFRDEIHKKNHYMLVFPEQVLYKADTLEEIREIAGKHIKQDQIVTELVVNKDFIGERFFNTYGDVAFFNKQTRLTLRNSGIIDPESLDDYIFYHGFQAIANALIKYTPEQVIDEVKKSGLRGRGGGGYSTGLKWELTRKTQADKRFIICNADEGDPGAFMDRSTLEGDPYSVIEGMLIGAYAMGAAKGYFYIRAEYPLAIKRVEQAIARCRAANLLGENILGSGFSFDLEVRLGAGAFVCGEETALMHSIEGLRGQPRIKPPYPSVSGLWGYPTAINNVETWANIPVIFLYGSNWFAGIGTQNSTGTKVFALAGDVKNTGLVEVPMGTTLREIIYDIGGGIPKNKALKAVQTGGPSGGCIPASAVDTTVDYDSLSRAGSIMGSGGMIILNEDNCMVDVARYFLDFTKDESCGKCTPCREGTLRMLEILNRITTGHGEIEDLAKLERLGNVIKKASLCGLGQTAPNPVLSNLKNFREEFIAHVVEKRCPSKRCAQLIRYKIDEAKCVGCTACARICPSKCISGTAKQTHVIDNTICIKCGQCFSICKFNAVKKE